MSELSPVDLARVRIAVEDHAAAYYGGPMHLGRADAVRYVTEAYLKTLPWKAAWRAVEAEVDARPEVLTWTEMQRAENKIARAEACNAADTRIIERFDAGDIDGALAVIDEAELINPDYRVNGWHTWGRLRDLIRQHAAKTAA